MYCSGFCNNVFFEHQRPHVICAEEQCKLADLQTLRDPTALDVGNVVEKQSCDSLCFEILERTSWRNVTHLRVIRLERPANESGEAMGFVLESTEPVEMFDPFCERFGMTEHHRR